ncbi:MAG: DUF2164 family protein [Candidatus Gracilibacteria bacterium]
MSEVKRKWDLLSSERRKVVIDEIIAYFGTERDEKIGVIAAGDMLDFFLQTIGEDIFNKAIESSKLVIKQSFDNMEIDLDLLCPKKCS